MSNELDKEIETYLEERFLDNLSVIETENNLRLNSYVKEQALLQVKMYWKKLKDLAQKVTESEVPITLSNQQTPKGKKFTIHGVVDIIKEHGETVLYDIKTHDPDFVKHNKDKYEKQLNLYGSIWEKVNQKALDKTAVIATPVPGKLRYALADGNPVKIQKAMEIWEPIIEMERDPDNREAIVSEFGHIVDKIEECEFHPPSVERLKEAMGSGNTIFARKICRNCDIRFACDSYREYSIGRRTLASDDLLHLVKEMGEEKEHQAFKNVSFEADIEKEFEASTEADSSMTENEFDTEENLVDG